MTVVDKITINQDKSVTKNYIVNFLLALQKSKEREKGNSDRHTRSSLNIEFADIFKLEALFNHLM